MFLKQSKSGHRIEVLTLNDLFNPRHVELVGRYHHGDEVEGPEKFKKSDLLFLSGEALPRCWTDPRYRDELLERQPLDRVP